MIEVRRGEMQIDMDYFSAMWVMFIFAAIALVMFFILGGIMNDVIFNLLGVVFVIVTVGSFFLCDAANGINYDIVVEIYDVEGIQTNTIYYNDTSIDTKTESVIISHGYYNGSTDVVVYVQYKRRFHWLFPVEKRDKKGIMIYLSEDNFDKITQQVITE